MTRINADLSPAALSDQHLMAEYRELPMVLSALRRSFQTQPIETILEKIPEHFVLGKGHVTFFYDKLEFLEHRYYQLRRELKHREFQLTERDVDFSGFPQILYNNWRSRDKDRQVIRARIRERLKKRPTWYRWFGTVDTYRRHCQRLMFDSLIM